MHTVHPGREEKKARKEWIGSWLNLPAAAIYLIIETKISFQIAHKFPRSTAIHRSTAVYECAAMSRSAAPRVSIAAHSRVSSQLIGGTAPTERKSRIRNNESREPRGLTRAVKPLWLYSAASPLFSFVLALFFFPSSFSPCLSTLFIAALPRLRFSSSRPRQFPFLCISRYTYYYTRHRAIALIPRIALTLRRISHAYAIVLDDHGDSSTNCESSE